MENNSTQIMIALVMVMFLGFGLYFSKIFDYYGEDNTFKGHYIGGFEASDFIPCDSHEVWWIENEDESGLYDLYTSVSSHEYQPIYIEVVASLSAPGHYGHLGAGTREMTVLEVLSVNKKAASCEYQGSWFDVF